MHQKSERKYMIKCIYVFLRKNIAKYRKNIVGGKKDDKQVNKL